MFHKKLQKSYLFLLDKLLNNYKQLTNEEITKILKMQKNKMEYNYIKLLNYYQELFLYLLDNKENYKKFIDKVPQNLEKLSYNNFDFRKLKLKPYKVLLKNYDDLKLKDYNLLIELKDFIKEGYKELTGDYLKEIILSDKKNLEIYIKNKLMEKVSTNNFIISKINNHNNNLSEKDKIKLINNLISNLEKFSKKNELSKDFEYLKEDINNILIDIKNNYHYINIDEFDKKIIFNNIFFFYNTLLKNFDKLSEDFIILISQIHNIKPFIDSYYNILPLIYLKIFELPNVNDIVYNQILFQLRKNKSL